MENKKFLSALGILAVIVIAAIISINIFSKNSPSVAPKPVGPQIVGQTPGEGQRLDLSAPIEILFDQEMDTLKTGESFTLRSPDGEPVSGKGTWTDAQTFIFTPDAPLAAGATYIATFSTSTSSVEGISPSEIIEVEFTTVEALAVAQIFPAQETQEVDPSSSITVIFNHPVVPLGIAEEQSKLPQPLNFSPEVPGAGEWVNSSVYVFQPEELLKSGTSYQVQIDAGLTDTNGNSLEDNFQWQFTTMGPVITNYALKDGIQYPQEEVKEVALDQAFVVSFSMPMDQKSVEAALTLIDRETRDAFPVNFEWDETSTTLTISPEKKFKLAGFYELSISTQARAEDGGFIREGMTILFETVPLPSVIGTFPYGVSDTPMYYDRITISFASRMDFESMKDKVSILPVAPAEENWYYNEYDKTLYIYGLLPATDYVVRVMPGMQDLYGNTIKDEVSFAFRNGDFVPYARLVLPWTPLVYRAKGTDTQQFFFEHRNVREATISVYPIDLTAFEKLMRGDLVTTDYQPRTEAIREWTVTASTPRNEMQYENFDFKDKSGRTLDAGYYFVGVTGSPLGYTSNFYQGFIFIVATDNITLKVTPTEGLAWITDLESGAPQKDVEVTFYNDLFKKIGTAKTDKDGLAYLDNIKNANYASINSDGHLGMTAIHWGADVSAGDFGLYQNYGGGTNLFSYIYTDRPIYRPNQEVFFKGILRENDDLHYSLPKEKQVYVVVEQYGENIYSEYVPINEQGSFSGVVKLAQDISLGPYNILVYPTSSVTDSAFSAVSFNVAEYKKPEFEVIVSADKTDILAGDTVNFDLDAKYYSGGNVQNAPANWFIESTTFYFSPAQKYNQYSFMDWDRDMYWSPARSTNNDVVDEGKGTTDETGHLEFSQTFEAGENKISQQMSLYANVSDVAGNEVSGGTSVVVHQSEYYAGIRSEQYIGKQGEPQPFSVVVLDWESLPIAGQTVTVDFVERQWFSVQKKDDQGLSTWETSVKEIPVSKQEAVTGADGTAQVEFIPTNGGVFKALVTVTDSKGNSHQASTYIWVASNGEIAWRQTNDRAFSLIADKDMYSPGDTAEILIAQPFNEKVYALITYERGHIYKQEVVLLEGNSTIYELPITDEMAPVAYVSVTVISGAEQGGAPDFKIGMAKINIDTIQKTLDVSVTTDKESAGPGDEVTYTIETRDIYGDPVSADVSLSVVDKAVLALAPSNTAPMLDTFYSEQALSVSTALGIVSSADDFNANYRKTIPDGSRAGGGGGGEAGIITVRANFKDTAAFEANVVTDKNGIAKVKVKLPENLTTWVADVRAVTADSRVGQITSELISTKPLFVQLQTPRFFIVNDQVQVGATVFNNTEKSLKVNVSLEAEGVKLRSESKQVVEVAGGQQAYVTWDIVVNSGAQRVDMTATAVSGQFTDASKPALGTLTDQGIPVFNFTAIETVGTSGMITNANSVTENIQLPSSLNFDDASLSIEISPSLAASMTSSFAYLEDYPYLCMEQTVSRFLPNVITTRALKEQGIPSPLQSDLDLQVNTALQKIYSKQLYDGGWNWWDGQESDPATSAYVVYGLIEAKESGYAVSESVLASGINYLKDNIPALDPNDPPWLYNRNAFMMYVLARADELGAGQTNFIFEHRTSLDNYGKAYLAQALYLLDKDDSRIDTLLADLSAATIQSAAGAHWEETTKDYWNWNSDTRTTAIVLNTFVLIDPQNPITANAVRWLMAHRDNGHWYSTQETTWSLIALTNWLVTAKEFDTDYKFAVGLNGDLLEQGKSNRENLTDSTKLQVELKDLLQDQVNALVISRGEGTGNLYYSAYLTASLPVDKIQPLDQGMSLSREYFAIDDPKTPITEIERGELVKVRLTVVVPAAVHYVVVNDPLPAGLEAIDSTLAADTAVPSSYTAQDYKERGWGWWYFSHIELRDEKVVLSTDYLPAGTYVYTYIARASTSGTFNVIPPTASEFYFPDVGGRGAGSEFTVK